MFRPMVAIFRLQVVLGVLKSYCKLYRAHNVEISTYLVNRCDKAQIKQTENKSQILICNLFSICDLFSVSSVHFGLF